MSAVPRSDRWVEPAPNSRVSGAELGARSVEKARFSVEVVAENVVVRLIAPFAVVQPVPSCVLVAPFVVVAALTQSIE